LPKGERFETKQDVLFESERSELLLRSLPGHSRRLARTLLDCREGDVICDRPFCPLCARRFRRWLTGELLRLTSKASDPIAVLTVLLEQATHGDIDELNLKKWQHRLRKRLVRSGLENASVVGGFEMIYRQKQHRWVLHINLVILGGSQAALDKFASTFDNSELGRPVLSTPLRDLAKQLSYVLKFTTYHRPFQQDGSSKGPAVPLNAPEHHALVKWMSQYDFADLLLLYNARRKGPIIKFNTCK
jgi:hypothetical protein